MVIYLYGPDSYRRIKKQKEIIQEYKSKHSGLTIDRFYLNDDLDLWDEFKDFINAYSLFGSKKLAVVSGLSSVALAKEDLSFLKSLTKDENTVVLISEDKKLNKDFDFLTKKPCLSQEFADLPAKQFGNFILKEAKEKSINLNNETINILMREYCPDSWAAVMELEKLALCGKTQIPAPNNQLVYKDSIFNLIYKLKSRNIKDRLRALEILLKTEDPAKVFNLSAYSVGQKIKFAQYDAMIKSGKLDYETALTEVVIC